MDRPRSRCRTSAAPFLGHVYGNNLSSDGWSEDGAQFRVNQLYYYAQYEELAFTLSAAPPDPGQLTLHLDDLQVQLGGVVGKQVFLLDGRPTPAGRRARRWR